uniref:J domain-containing protein n=1 Tax=viral metagenome TaxID=1070528 RepID=A0A6C0KBV1_9ZZZZ
MAYNPDWERPEFKIDSNNTDEGARKRAPLRRSVQIPQYEEDEELESEKSCTGSLCSSISNAFSGGKTKKRRRKRRKSRKKRKRKTRRKSKKKTRRKRGRGNAFKRTAKAAAVGAVVLGSSAAAAQNTQLPNQAEFEETKYQLCRADPNSGEGRKLFRQIALKHHPDKYSAALRAEATVNFQTLNSAFQGSSLSCVRRTRKNRPKPRPRPTPTPKPKPTKKKPPKKKPPKKKPSKPKPKPGKKGEKKRLKRVYNNIRNAASAMGIASSLVTAVMIERVQRAKRAFRLGKQDLGEDPNRYIKINGHFPITTQKFILYVLGRDVEDDIVNTIAHGEGIIEWEEQQQEEKRRQRLATRKRLRVPSPRRNPIPILSTSRF